MMFANDTKKPLLMELLVLGDIMSMQALEDNLGFADDWVPIQSSNTMSGDGGRPSNESQGKTLTESGEQTKETDQNSNR